MADKAKKDAPKQYKNVGDRTYHLASRGKESGYFNFAPGDVIEAASPAETKLLDGMSDVREFTGEPLTIQEKHDALEKENKDLRDKLEKAKKD